MEVNETKGATHTPGPWRYQEESDDYTHIVRAGDRFVCQLGQDTSGVAEANARLIAAAPDLLWALKQIIADLPTRRDWLDPGVENFARVTIAEAEGAA